MPPSNFLSSIFCTLSSFPLLLQQPPHSTTFPYVCKGLLTFHISCAVLFPSLSFHLVPVFIYIQVFPLSFLYLVSNHAFIFFTSLFLLEFPCTRTLGSNFLCRLFVVLNRMFITSALACTVRLGCP